ncbi:hypothetical protein ACJX0J_039513, partial [Zea mays]
LKSIYVVVIQLPRGAPFDLILLLLVICHVVTLIFLYILVQEGIYRGLDLVGILKNAPEGYTLVLVAIDKFTKYFDWGPTN